MKLTIAENIDTTKYLYHATYTQFLDSIKKYGLGNTTNKMWSDSKANTVYLADDPYIAESYAETAEWLDEVNNPDEYLDNIIILQIDIDKLDKSKLSVDSNILLNDGEDNVTWEYCDIIPFSACSIFTESQNTLKEEYDYNELQEIEEYLIDTFYGMSETELLSYFDESMETGGGAIWILPDGKTIELDLHSDFGSKVFYKFCKDYFKNHPEYAEDYSEDDVALDDWNDFNDHLVYNLGWLKFNSGTLYDDRYYVVLPRKKITSNQFRTFENILEETADQTTALLVIPQLIPSITYYFSKHTPKDVIKSLQKFFVSGILEESIQKVQEGFYITDSPFVVKDLLLNKPTTYRILYDAKIDMYALCDANLFIHLDMIKYMLERGYYAGLEDYIMSLGGIFNYIEAGLGGQFDENDEEIDQFLYCFIFDPDGDWAIGDDDYNHARDFSFGRLLMRDNDFNDTKLYQLLKRADKQSEIIKESNISSNLLNKIVDAWCAETAHPAYANKWSKNNPAAGQCLVTALVIQDELGGDIYDCKVGRSRHFYNVIDGETIDITFSQFPEGSEITDSRKRDRKQLLANKETRERYELLKNKVRGTNEMVIKEAASKEKEYVCLEYPSLTITVGRQIDVDDIEEAEVTKPYDYYIEKQAAVDYIIECCLDESDIPNLYDLSDAEIEAFVLENFDDLFDKYNKKFLEFFEEFAIEDFSDNYGYSDYEDELWAEREDMLYQQWVDDHLFDEVVSIRTKEDIKENWDQTDDEFILYVLNRFEDYLATSNFDYRDNLDSLLSRFLAKGLTKEVVDQTIVDMEYYLDYSGVELDDEVDLNHGSIWDWTDEYTHYLIVEQNFAEVLNTVAYEGAKRIYDKWREINKQNQKIIESANQGKLKLDCVSYVLSEQSFKDTMKLIKDNVPECDYISIKYKTSMVPNATTTFTRIAGVWVWTNKQQKPMNSDTPNEIGSLSIPDGEVISRLRYTLVHDDCSVLTIGYISQDDDKDFII